MSSTYTALVSIHDVMPETMDEVERIVELVEQAHRSPVTLLVVPGRAWCTSTLERLRTLVTRGHEVAAHGWLHRAERIRGLKHRVHAALLSRDVAEHLALDESGISDLMRRSHDWFAAQGLPTPMLYVPPAWALGSISPAALRSLPFTQVEVLGGIVDVDSGKIDRIPVVGYEVDRGWSVAPVKIWNRRARTRAARSGWLRIGIHPFDLDLPLAQDLERDLAAGRRGASYAELAASAASCALE